MLARGAALWYRSLRFKWAWLAQEGWLLMTATRETIEVTAGEVAAELKRRGIGSDEKVTITIEPEQEIIPGRRASRARVVAAGLTDADVDRLIKQAQKDVEPLLPG
jgi:hypothetical protein